MSLQRFTLKTGGPTVVYTLAANGVHCGFERISGPTMTVPSVHSRRLFLKAALRAAQGSALTLTLPTILTACDQATQARRDGAGLTVLDAKEASELEAVAARIIPSDETPGAKEAGVIYFIDNVMSSRPEQLADLRSGLQELQARSAEQYGSSTFAALTAPQQDGLLSELEQTPFFATVRYLSIAGMFSLPQYGGNRGGIGYQLIGFDDQHVWTPPFGSYDADYRERGQ